MKTTTFKIPATSLSFAMLQDLICEDGVLAYKSIELEFTTDKNESMVLPLDNYAVNGLDNYRLIADRPDVPEPGYNYLTNFIVDLAVMKLSALASYFSEAIVVVSLDAEKMERLDKASRLASYVDGLIWTDIKLHGALPFHCPVVSDISIKLPLVGSDDDVYTCFYAAGTLPADVNYTFNGEGSFPNIGSPDVKRTFDYVGEEEAETKVPVYFGRCIETEEFPNFVKWFDSANREGRTVTVNMESGDVHEIDLITSNQVGFAYFRVDGSDEDVLDVTKLLDGGAMLNFSSDQFTSEEVDAIFAGDITGEWSLPATADNVYLLGRYIKHCEKGVTFKDSDGEITEPTDSLLERLHINHKDNWCVPGPFTHHEVGEVMVDRTGFQDIETQYGNTNKKARLLDSIAKYNLTARQVVPGETYRLDGELCIVAGYVGVINGQCTDEVIVFVEDNDVMGYARKTVRVMDLD